MGSLQLYQRVKRQVCEILPNIPPGRISTYGDIGRALHVPARHVAFIIARLDDMDRAFLPWHRVVGDNGRILRHRWRAAQAAALIAEGHGLDPKGQLAEFSQRFIAVEPHWFTSPTEVSPDA